MIHIYVCDDSVEFRRIFDQTLKKLVPMIFPESLEWNLEAGSGSGKELLKHINKSNVDVLFLDIDMPEMNGLELARNIVAMKKDTTIIFVSGYDHYVYQVFDLFPFAYMRKDHILDELPHILSRIADKYDRENRTVTLITINGKVFIDEREIVYIQSQNNYYKIKTQGGASLICRGTLREAEQILLNFDYFRIHSAFIVNMNHIQRIEQSNIFVSNQKSPLPIAQRRLAAFREAYSKFTLRSFNL